MIPIIHFQQDSLQSCLVLRFGSSNPVWKLVGLQNSAWSLIYLMTLVMQSFIGCMVFQKSTYPLCRPLRPPRFQRPAMSTTLSGFMVSVESGLCLTRRRSMQNFVTWRIPSPHTTTNGTKLWAISTRKRTECMVMPPNGEINGIQCQCRTVKDRYLPHSTKATAAHLTVLLWVVICLLTGNLFLFLCRMWPALQDSTKLLDQEWPTLHTRRSQKEWSGAFTCMLLMLWGLGWQKMCCTWCSLRNGRKNSRACAVWKETRSVIVSSPYM